MNNIDFSQAGAWLDGSGPFSDIIISSRLRLHRNLKGVKFVSWADNQKLKEITDNLLSITELTDYLSNSSRIKLDELDNSSPNLFPERFIVNHKFLSASHPRGLIIGEKEYLSILINNNDHLNIQVYNSGLNLDDNYLLLSKLEDELEEHLNFAYSEQFGYLSPLPTLAGTGLKASFMVHLPAMLNLGELETIMKTLSKIRCNFTSLFSSGPQIIQGDLFIISNQVTLGVTEEEIIDSLSKIAIELLNYETNAREKLLRINKFECEDEIFRSLGILINARSVSFDELIKHLSMIRLGISLDLIDDITSKTLNKLLIILQPEHLNRLFKEEIEEESENIVRAKLLREELAR